MPVPDDKTKSAARQEAADKPRALAIGAYKLGDLLLSAIPALVQLLLVRSVGLFVKHAPIEFKDVPDNAIVYLLHGDVMGYEMTHRQWRAYLNPADTYLGYHGFKSYIGALTPFLDRLGAFRYDRWKSEKPMEQVLEHLRQSRGRFIIRTDAGGPYGKVRSSLFDMAIATGRPLVPMRQIASRSLTIFDHPMALPGATLVTLIGNTIAVAELLRLGRVAAVQLLQERIDVLRIGGQ